MVKNLSCVSCAAGNVFSINSLLSFASPDTHLLRSKHEPLSLTEEFLTGPFLGAHALSKRNHHITAN